MFLVVHVSASSKRRDNPRAPLAVAVLVWTSTYAMIETMIDYGEMPIQMMTMTTVVVVATMTKTRRVVSLVTVVEITTTMKTMFPILNLS